MSEQLLIHFDKEKFQSQIERLETFIPEFFEKSITAFNDLKIGTFEKDDFIQLFSDPENFLFEKLMDDKPLELAGIKVSKERLFDLLEKPSGYDLLIVKIKTLQDEVNRLSPQVFTNNIFNFLGYFEFDTDNKIQLNSEVKDRLKRNNEIWIIKDSSQKLFKFLKDLEKLFNGSELFLENATPPFYRTEDFIRRYLPFDSTEKKFKLAIEQVKMFDNKI